MSKCKHGAFAIVLGVISSLLAVSPHHQASAAEPRYYYTGHAGGSQVLALGTRIRHDLTGASSVSGTRFGASDRNRVAGVNAVNGLVRLGAVSTWARTREAGNGGVQITTGARTADISLLGGLIRADAVETETVATRTPQDDSHRTRTRLVGLTIAGQRYPADIPRNTSVTIPGVATVVLNAAMSTKAAGGSYNYGYGMYLQLLAPYGRAPALATVMLNPTYSVIAPAPPERTYQLGGAGFGTRVQAAIGDTLEIDAGPTAAVYLPPAGTGGATLSNTTLGVDASPILRVDAVKTWTRGTSVPRLSRARMVNEIGRVDVLDGLITADAIRVSSKTVKRGDRPIRKVLRATFVDLVVGGRRIAANVAPNTTINVAGVGVVTLNKQVRTRNSGAVFGVHLTLSTEREGLPAGAVIELSAAGTYVIA